jgi:molybdopterin molybdotransferase
MADLMPVSVAVERIVGTIRRLQSEPVAVSSALGRVLAADVVSPLDLPPFDNSAMDGYAVRSQDTASTPITLRVVDDIPAGRAPSRDIGPGEAARIMTGAPMPSGADAVVPVELTSANWGGMPGVVGTSSVTINTPVGAGDAVRLRGENVRGGQRLLPDGQSLRPQDLGILASVGLGSVEVVRRPRAAILTSGDELIAYGQPLPPGGIYDGNSPMLAALVIQYGGDAVILAPARDDLDSVRTTFRAALSLKPDLIVSSAGVSVGAADYVKAVLDELGTVDFWKINVRPGRPLAYGTLGGVPFFGLPGNPVSAMVTCELAVKPAVYAMLGRADDSTTVSAIAGEDIDSDGRRSYLRCTLEVVDGRYVARLTRTQSSGALYSLVEADGLLIVPEGVRSMARGSDVEVRLLR